jgi:gluconate 2-dehydrogenase alpha chain
MLSHDNGMATGVNYVDAHGEVHHQPADIVVCSAFTFSNVRMLLLSKSPKHPQGIGNDRGMVGKNYTYQLFLAPAKGMWDARKFNFYMGNTCTMSFVYEYNGDNFDHGPLDFIGGAAIYSQPGEREPISSAEDVLKDLVDDTYGLAWKNYLREHWDGIGTINIQGESLPYEDQFVDLDPVYTDRFGLPLLRLTFDWHDNDRKLYRFVAQKCQDIAKAMGATKVALKAELDPYDVHTYQSTHPTGGAIMGTDPSDSVTNSYGQVWDTPNVFVTGAALYPHNPGANPTGTITALTYRAADKIRDRYLDHQRELLV